MAGRCRSAGAGNRIADTATEMPLRWKSAYRAQPRLSAIFLSRDRPRSVCLIL